FAVGKTFRSVSGSIFTPLSKRRFHAAVLTGAVGSLSNFSNTSGRICPRFRSSRRLKARILESGQSNAVSRLSDGILFPYASKNVSRPLVAGSFVFINPQRAFFGFVRPDIICRVCFTNSTISTDNIRADESKKCPLWVDKDQRTGNQ